MSYKCKYCRIQFPRKSNWKEHETKRGKQCRTYEKIIKEEIKIELEKKNNSIKEKTINDTQVEVEKRIRAEYDTKLEQEKKIVEQKNN